MRRDALISIHDVWPGNQDRIDRDLEWLRERGVPFPALFVVPNYHGHRSIDAEPAFLEWLRGRQFGGSEIFMHGYRHLRPESLGEPARRSLFGKWINGRVRNEGEFAGLDEAQTRSLLQKGLEIMGKSALQPEGFAMPAWLGRIPRGFAWPESCRFFDGRFYLWDRIARRCVWAPVLTFGITAASRPYVFGGALWTAYLRRAALVRIALHPGDLEHESVRRIVAGVLGTRKRLTYVELFR